ncbi:hypothetical protein ES319_D06G012700v1 [Gossypium barbadense]|uniref:Disease resistance protein winged helix domain-containing protein n=2 Tax=Gossypium TaxID=3633 RepID=A0A5J5QWD8_GOSBA|nr:hypothetical protein ES319_D06G012700v1 [Gossypium barbadense]TYG63247.1 hypothetical protein ES288_D06G013600v1 [Gossypium darwinii]
MQRSAVFIQAKSLWYGNERKQREPGNHWEAISAEMWRGTVGNEESEWLCVNDSEIWDLEDEGSRILAVLRLSYEHLPPYMRQCFSFCSIFPKDSVMTKDKLLALWMANGFSPSRGPLDLHDMDNSEW